MIIWLASYPKSGNTWLRLFLQSLIFNEETLDINNIKIPQFPQKFHFDGLVNNFDNLEEVTKQYINAQIKINSDKKIKFFKTHSAYWKAYNTRFTDEENTLGIIHIVRDPRNVITSVLNHFNKENHFEAFEFMNDPAKVILNKKYENTKLKIIVSSWANHYNSWKKFKKNNLLVQYEKLLSDPIFEFNKICNFLNKIASFNFEKDKILKAIEKCHFKNLQRIENENGFVEASQDIDGSNKKFFNLGPQNDWKKTLGKETIMKIENSFENEMKELGYLD